MILMALAWALAAAITANGKHMPPQTQTNKFTEKGSKVGTTFTHLHSENFQRATTTTTTTKEEGMETGEKERKPNSLTRFEHE